MSVTLPPLAFRNTSPAWASIEPMPVRLPLRIVSAIGAAADLTPFAATDRSPVCVTLSPAPPGPPTSAVRLLIWVVSTAELATTSRLIADTEPVPLRSPTAKRFTSPAGFKMPAGSIARSSLSLTCSSCPAAVMFAVRLFRLVVTDEALATVRSSELPMIEPPLEFTAPMTLIKTALPTKTPLRFSFTPAMMSPRMSTSVGTARFGVMLIEPLSVTSP